ncbi:type II secretion system major pseudopilin GspG [Cloacibacillus evryensis]|uniref:type II secretion system major pseudopilin GspG n=1 Tax=Cloacibacillus evryensis TaxID=508460 RepID=UPI000240DE8B|nr:type II secretion system major pseudopilin GspG [Cloacibacillus evryensis]EHL69869.1 general secretion pathway protein G [Synergistes sp. 3_1_syn1]EXG78121.1 type II secretion system protein G (GspG) [Cloacibacillus evryensis DSM 19522]MEA5033869.1 type II secretion system major pseudopilin GspG [Cloacibacillus evryensis]
MRDHNKKLMKKRRGFTLIEIMVVVVIIGLLSALVGPRLMGQSDEAKRKTTQTQIAQLEQVLGLYYLDNGFYPTTSQGLEALVKEPTMPPEPLNYKKGGYMKKVPKDAWGREFVYTAPGEHGDVDILSYGADGQEGGSGANADIANWD